MNNNISGSAGGWVDSVESESKTTKSTEVVDYSEAITQLNDLHTTLQNKYDTKPSKPIYDGLTLIKSAINALMSN